MTARVLAAALVLGVLGAAPAAAAAEPVGRRHALVIGANVGAGDEVALRYAERDAQRMAELLQRVGGVQGEDVTLLLAPSAADVRRALAALRARIDPAGGATLVVYYSGHADAAGFHLGPTTLTFAAFKAALRELPVDLAIVIADACRAGGLVTAKGGRLVTAEPLTLDDGVAGPTRGLAILTSSSRDEDSQESDRLAGGVFSHHLMSGLMGAADASGDDDVSLGELHRYVYAQTVEATAVTAIRQHPVFAFDLSGHVDPVLARLGLATRGALVFADAGHYLVSESDGERHLVAELDAPSGARLVVRPGVYRVRRLTLDGAWEGQVVVPLGAAVTVTADALAAVPFRHAVRKGYGQPQRRAWSLGAGFEATSDFVDLEGAIASATALVQLDLPSVALALRLRYGVGAGATPFVRFEHQLVGLDLGVYHLFPLAAHGVGFGLRGGFDWLHQSFEAYGEAPDVDALLPRVGPFARAELALAPSVVVTIDIGLEVWGVSRAETEASVTATGGIGLAFELP